MSNQSILVDAPFATPVAISSDVKFSISMVVREIFITISIGNTIYTLIVKPNIDYLLDNINIGSVVIMIAMLVAYILILYAPLAQLLSAEFIVPIYSPQTIIEPSMVTNIFSRIENSPTLSYWDRITKNINNPSWSADIIPIYNKIVMSFYETTRLIAEQLRDIRNDIANLNITVVSNNNNRISFEAEVIEEFNFVNKNIEELKASHEELKASHEEMKASHEEMRNEMRNGFAELKALIISNNNTTYAIL